MVILPQGRLRTTWRIEPGSKPFLRVTRAPEESEPSQPAKRKRKRSPSKTGTGRGTGRGGKEAADKLLRPLKAQGPRAGFLRFIGGRAVTIDQVRQQFDMSHANVNGYLTNIHRDHGIGYAKEGGVVRLQLPPGCTWQNVWGK